MKASFKNEVTIKIGGRDILLRPTFENIFSIEHEVANLSHLTWRITNSASRGDLKNSLAMTDAAKIIYFGQANKNPENINERELNLSEIWDLVQAEGNLSVSTQIIIFLSKITMGNRNDVELSDNVKKN
jgi:hypothetical protein